jgi:hypothetical protein
VNTENIRCDLLFLCVQGILLFAGRFSRSNRRRICLEATTVEIETLTPRLVSTVAMDGLLLMLSEFY